MHVSMERTVWGPSGVTRLTVNICAGAARGAATREAASLETPENARVEEASVEAWCEEHHLLYPRLTSRKHSVVSAVASAVAALDQPPFSATTQTLHAPCRFAGIYLAPTP